jgi:hypothetical protein
MSVRGVLAETHIAHQDELRKSSAESVEGLLHDPLFGPCATPDLVLFGGDSEEEDSSDLQLRGLLRIAKHLIDRGSKDPRHRANRLPDPLPGLDEERKQELRRR